MRLYESFETELHNVYVMEVCGGGDLITYVRRRRKLKEDLARKNEAFFAAKNIVRQDEVFILSRWSGLDVQTIFQVNYFHQLRIYRTSCILQIEMVNKI